jgi:hypothetical protein
MLHCHDGLRMDPGGNQNSCANAIESGSAFESESESENASWSGNAGSNEGERIATSFGGPDEDVGSQRGPAQGVMAFCC